MTEKQKPVDITPQPATAEAARETRERLERGGLTDTDPRAAGERPEQRGADAARQETANTVTRQSGARPVTTEVPRRDPADPSADPNSDDEPPDRPPSR